MFKEHHCSKRQAFLPGYRVPGGGRGGETWHLPCTGHRARFFMRLNLLNPLKHSSELGYHPHGAKEEIEGQDLSKVTQQR